MKKILIPIEANKELPKTSNNYPTFVGISFTELYFNAVDKTWYCPLTPEDVPTNNEVLWYKEISEEEYLQQKLEEDSNNQRELLIAFLENRISELEKSTQEDK